MRVKNAKTPVKLLGASILFAFVSQLAACGGTTDDTSVAEPGVKQLTEGQVTGSHRLTMSRLRFTADSLTQHHRLMICAGGHLRHPLTGQGLDRLTPSLTAVTSRVIRRPLYGAERTSPSPRTVFT